MNCRQCNRTLEQGDKFCSTCGKPCSHVTWSLAGPGALSQPSAADSTALSIPEGGAFLLVAFNEGTSAVQVEVDLSAATGVQGTGSGRNVPLSRMAPPGGSARFELRHAPGKTLGGIILLRSRDGLREVWWETSAWREESLVAAYRVRVHLKRWFAGSPVVLFPPGVRKQRVQVWNDAPEERVLAAPAPPGFRATCFTLPLEKTPPKVKSGEDVPLVFLAEPSAPGATQMPLNVWSMESGAEPVQIRCLPGARAAGQSEPDVVIALDFGTRNTSVRVRWHHALVRTKPAGTVDAIGDETSGGEFRRFPTCMILHPYEASFSWGRRAQERADQNRIAPEEVVIRDLKTDLRNGIENYKARNPRWTNDYLLGRYFEQIFASIDRYLAGADPEQPLQRMSLNVRYVLTRPVLDANEGDANGKLYEAALLLALVRCGVTEEQVTFVHEPEAAALGIAWRRREELLALAEGTPVAVIDSGGGTTDIAVARVRHANGTVTLDIVGTYRLLLSDSVPGRENSLVHDQKERDDQEFGGDVLDEVMAHFALTDAAKIADADDGAPPHVIDATPSTSRKDFEVLLRQVHRAFKEAFVFQARCYYNLSQRESGEQVPFPTRNDLDGVYVLHGLFAENVVFPLLRNAVRRTALEIGQSQSSSQASSAVLPSEIRHAYFVGGTNIDAFVRQALAEIAPSIQEQLMADRLIGKEAADTLIEEKLYAVIEGAVRLGEALGEPSPLSLTLRIRGREVVPPLIRQGETLPPESLAKTVARADTLLPGEMLEAELWASGSGLDAAVPVARAFFRNETNDAQSVTLRCRVTQEKGCTAELALPGEIITARKQWQFLLTPTQQ